MYKPRTIGNAVDQIARQSIGKDWSLYAALLDHWQEIVGLEYAQITTPVKVSFPHQPNESRRSKGTLCVKLPKGLTMEFTFKTEQIKQRINNYFGYSAIGKITFEPMYNVAPTKLTPTLELAPEQIAEIKEAAQTIDNEELRAALQSFGEIIAKSPPQR